MTREIELLSPADLHRRLKDPDANITVIDLRSVGEYAEYHIDGAYSYVLLIDRPHKNMKPASLYVLVDATGNHCDATATVMQEQGIPVGVLKGGMYRWRREGYPTVKPRIRPFPSLRIIFIVVLCLFLASILLGIFWGYGWWWLSGALILLMILLLSAG